MSAITCYEHNNTPLDQSYFWDTVSYLVSTVPEEIVIITPNHAYRQALIELLCKHSTNQHLPSVQSFDDWINQLLNCEPYSYFECYHHLLTLIDSQRYRTTLPFLVHDNMVKALLHFFMFLITHDYTFDSAKSLFPAYLNSIEDECKSLFLLFKKRISQLYNTLSVTVKCQRLQQRRSIIRSQLSNKTVVYIGFTQLSKSHRYLLQRLLSLTAQSTFYTAKQSPIHQWLVDQFDSVSFIPQPDSPPSTKTIPIYTFNTVADECRWIVKDLLRRKQDHPSSVIQLVVPNLQSYGPILHHIAAEFKLDLHSSRVALFKHTAVCKSLQDILLFLKKPHHVASLEALFSSPLIRRLKINQSFYTIDLALILRVLRQESVSVGFNAIKHAFEYHISLTQKKIDQQLDVDQHSILLQRLKTQCKLIEFLYDSLSRFNQATSVIDWLDCFLACLEMFDMTSSSDDPALSLEPLLQHLPRFARSWRMDTSFSTVMICDRLLLFLETLTYEDLNHPSSLVYLHTLQEAAYFPADFSYVLGFTDACWPYHIAENQFIQLATTTSFIDCVDDDPAYQCRLLAQLLAQPSCLAYPGHYQGKDVQLSRFFYTLPYTFDTQTPVPKSDLTSLCEYVQQPVSALDANYVDKDYITQKYDAIQNSSYLTLTHPTVLSQLVDQLKQTPFSATRLDLYQRCPLHYYYRYILGYDTIQDLQEGISPSEWGILIHDMMFRFNENKNYSSKQQLLDAAQKAFNALSTSHFYWQQKKDMLFGTPSQPGLIDAIFDTLTELPYRLNPGQFELDFNWTLSHSPYTLKGKIDALFYTDQREPVIVDYKTSQTLSSSADFEYFRSLQLPIYGLSIYKQTGQIPVGSLLFQLHSPSKTDVKVVACTKDAKKDTFDLKRKRPFLYTSAYFDALETHLSELIKLLQSGFIGTDHHPLLAQTHKTRSSSTCRHCDYVLHCQYKDRFNAVY